VAHFDPVVGEPINAAPMTANMIRSPDREKWTPVAWAVR
jgi:hypothetical protein